MVEPRGGRGPTGQWCPGPVQRSEVDAAPARATAADSAEPTGPAAVAVDGATLGEAADRATSGWTQSTSSRRTARGWKPPWHQRSNHHQRQHRRRAPCLPRAWTFGSWTWALQEQHQGRRPRSSWLSWGRTRQQTPRAAWKETNALCSSLRGGAQLGPP